MQIQSQIHSYRVVECDSVRAAFQAPQDSESTFYLVDEKVAELFAEDLAQATPAARVYRVRASEEAKSYEQLPPIFCWLIEAGCKRNSQLVVIGGGVLQDIGCFIASTLFRGIRWTLTPTTLLAQCDSCIGSKSSLNIGRFKNQLGTFYPPHEVRLAYDFLKTLSTEELLSGLGEAIKLHLIDGAGSVERLRQKLNSRDLAELPLPEIIRDSLRIKQRFIEADEFDRGIRNLLNYGHTFAHAFESATHYEIPHGIAVTQGVVCATYFSERLGLTEGGHFRELAEWLRPFYQPYADSLKRVDLGSVLGAMKQDKKNSGGKITFILTRGPGKMEKMGLEAPAALALLQDCRENL